MGKNSLVDRMMPITSSWQEKHVTYILFKEVSPAAVGDDVFTTASIFSHLLNISWIHYSEFKKINKYLLSYE